MFVTAFTWQLKPSTIGRVAQDTDDNENLRYNLTTMTIKCFVIPTAVICHDPIMLSNTQLGGLTCQWVFILQSLKYLIQRRAKP